MELKTKLTSLPGIGYSLSQKLENLGLYTVEDLIYHFPFRYDDFSNLTNAIDSQIDQKVTLRGELWSIQNIHTRNGKVLTKAVFQDGTIPIELIWFNQSWLAKTLSVGDKLQIAGKLTKYQNKLSIIAPVWEKIVDLGPINKNEGIHTGKLIAVYPETEGISSKWIRTRINKLLDDVLPQIEDYLPSEVKDDMLDLSQAIRLIHFPENIEDAEKSRQRLSFDELFLMQLISQKIRREWKNKVAIDPFEINRAEINKLIDSLPFKLTTSQIKVLDNVFSDLSQTQAMNRLIQGEVGSGKTVVAAIVAYLTYLNHFKVFYMAPTEILAFQHKRTFESILAPFGVKVGIYTGSQKFTKVKKGQLQEDPDIIIGTHALLSEKLISDNIGLVIIDEQQRFGVEQRGIVRSKAKIPHFLTMTATPIPRTIALTFYGDLDISIIDSMPQGRQIVKTHVVPARKRKDAYKFIEERVKNGEQVYIITPLIELSETMKSAKAATEQFHILQKMIFPKLKLGLLHGRLKPKEKDQVLNDFKDRKIDILISTSVVEVGVDVPNATIMVIESAERFGLSQLHQLRGRVGRGNMQSYCLLFTSSDEVTQVSRLKNLETISNGLKLSELDLKIRGSGQLFGIKQSGRVEFKIASFSDLALIEKTREEAKKLLEKDLELDKYPQLKTKLHSLTGVTTPD